MRRSSLAGAGLLAFFVLSSSSASGTEICHAENDGGGFGQIKMMVPELTAAVRFKASKSFTCVAIQVFTGKAGGTNKVSLFSHNAGLDQPLANLGTGVFTASTQDSWQGELLDSAVALTAGSVYWMVWTTQDGAQASVDVPMATPGQPYRLSSDGGSSWSALVKDVSHHWKLRLFGEDGCCTGFGWADTYGTECPGTPGKSPQWDDFSGCPTPGGHFVLDASGLAGAPALLLIGSGTGSTPINPACALQVLPLFPVAVSFQFPPGGAIQLPAGVPLATPVPIDIYAQILVADPGGSFGVASTRGLQVHIE